MKIANPSVALLLVAAATLSVSCKASPAEATPDQSLIPAGWELSANTQGGAKGDLNGDSIADIAFAVGLIPTVEYKDYDQTRLLVYFGQADGSYELAVDNPKLIPKQPEIWSGYLPGKSSILDISNDGILKISTVAGGAGESTTGDSASFKFMEGDWYVVGSSYFHKWLFSSGSVDQDGWTRDQTSSNFLTRIYRAYSYVAPSAQEREKGMVIKEVCEQGEYAEGEPLKRMDELLSIDDAAVLKSETRTAVEASCSEKWAEES